MNDRNCYCGLWDTHPETLMQEGIKRGYCGICQTCGRPGHTRHFPGKSPVTGSWCDTHYRRLAWIHPLGWYGAQLYPVLGIILVVMWAVLTR